MGHLRLALTISVRHGRPMMMAPRPSSTARLASSSFCSRVSDGQLEGGELDFTHGVLYEGIRHAVAVALHLAADLDENGAETAEDAGNGRLEGAIVLVLSEAAIGDCNRSVMNDTRHFGEKEMECEIEMKWKLK